MKDWMNVQRSKKKKERSERQKKKKKWKEKRKEKTKKKRKKKENIQKKEREKKESFGLVLWHIKHCWLLNAKSCFYIYIKYMSYKHILSIHTNDQFYF